MGDRAQTPPGALSTNDINSVSLFQSINDWWTTSSALMKPTENTPAYQTARIKNLLIEYDLYMAILSDDIKINKPGELPKYTQDGIIVGSFKDTELEDGNFIHEFNLENRHGAPSETIVIMHGYMAASGYFVKNFEALVKSKPGSRLHVIDMPGFGNSSRPRFPSELLQNYPDKYNQINQVLGVENWFIDKFEQWRIANSIDKFKLISHSMGAYLSCCYLAKYNFNQVSEFLVVSPMGTESNYTSLLNSKDLQVNHHELGGRPLEELVQQQSENGEVHDNDELTKLWESLGRPKFPENLVLKKLWEWKISPFQLLQLFGPMFSKFLSLWSYQRFRNLKDSNGETNHDLLLKLHYYSYSIFNQYQGSGELAITKLINHEILPKLPLCDRQIAEFFTENKIKTLWLYGEKDWMNFKGGEYIYKKLKELGADAEFKIVENAGHHIYLDNPEEFNKIALNFFDL
ncbi:hypothetical protein CANTEDRAFT_108823 [Yamadazyma tenuis ATCC 10573]|uniref:AB hydrolase-1 domain-containing protein n=2 Tax=Candida tenuis TaxID=2315449 RepID=G3B7U5_CANTC|nr:uncharacterized protein CANTEDRAFT_108823 [Yamadazyma tenuis ATCC 10573]EGV62325.1 hypothetical protein CANTEDRAFT_108823 [Yamadazyma tenuis ATCC 10573]